MTHDPRAVANALLVRGGDRGMTLSNASLNKILFFAHAEHLSICRKPLINKSFEAWEFGPVVPMIYRQFKAFGSKPITKLATFICPETGEDLVIDYRDARIDVTFIDQVLDRYGGMSVSTLITLSHVAGGPWDRVWNGARDNTFGMTISDDLIEKYFLTPANGVNGKYYVN